MKVALALRGYMNWIHSLMTVEGAQQELAAFDITLRGPIWALLIQRLVVEGPAILLTRETLRASCAGFCDDPNAFHRALERHRKGSPELPKDAHAYVTNPSLKSEAVRARTGAYPMSCYFAFVLLPRIAKRRGTYDRQQFFADFPRDLVSEDTLEKVWSIWEGHARAGRFGLTWDADEIRDQQSMPAFDAMFSAAPHTPSHFEIVRDDMFTNGESFLYEIVGRTGLTREEVRAVLKEYSYRAKDKSKRFFLFGHYLEGVGFAPNGMRGVVYDQARRFTQGSDFNLSQMAFVLNVSEESTILGDAFRKLVKDGWLQADKRTRPYRYSVAPR